MGYDPAMKSDATTIMAATIRDRLEVIEQYVKAGKVLDVGCVDARPGRDSSASRLDRKVDLLFKRIVELSDDAMGVDIDADGIEILRQGGYNVVAGDAATMDLGVQFDTIVAGEVIEHVSNVGQFLANLGRHLTEDGVLIITTPNPYWSAQIGRIWRRGRCRVHEEHTAWFDPITLQTAMRRAGLSPVAGYWVQPKRSLAKRWRQVFRPYFSRTFMIVARKSD